MNRLIRGILKLVHIGSSDTVIQSPDCFVSLIAPMSGDAINLIAPMTESINLKSSLNGDAINLVGPICDC